MAGKKTVAGDASGVTLELGGAQFWSDLRMDPKALAATVCHIDLNDLERTCQRHPALRAWINAAHETARMNEEKAEYALKLAQARALLQAKSEKDAHTDKAKTVQVLDAEVQLNEEVQRLTALLHAAQDERGGLRAMSNALEDRLQMLIQLSAKRRQEEQDYGRR